MSACTSRLLPEEAFSATYILPLPQLHPVRSLPAPENRLDSAPILSRKSFPLRGSRHSQSFGFPSRRIPHFLARWNLTRGTSNLTFRTRTRNLSPVRLDVSRYCAWTCIFRAACVHMVIIFSTHVHNIFVSTTTEFLGATIHKMMVMTLRSESDDITSLHRDCINFRIFVHRGLGQRPSWPRTSSHCVWGPPFQSR
jgi:hypothetical protein